MADEVMREAVGHVAASGEANELEVLGELLLSPGRVLTPVESAADATAS